MNLSWTRILEVLNRHRIIYGVLLSLVIAMIMTAISMALYVSSGASRLDLSRPGYERVRDETINPGSDDSFSASGPMNPSVANDFQSRFSKHRQSLSRLDTYGTNALDDTELQIAPQATQ